MNNVRKDSEDLNLIDEIDQSDEKQDDSWIDELYIDIGGEG